MASIKRERELARERWLRQQARRAENETRRRHRRKRIALAVAALLVLGVVALAVMQYRPTGDSLAATEPPATAPADPTPADPSEPTEPAPSAAAGECTYTKQGEAARKVDLPPAGGPAPKPYTATLKLSQGDVVFEALTDKAPCTTRSFAHLAENDFYRDTTCHRLTTEGLFVLQCGDPTGTGGGGPGYAYGIENTPADGTYPAGTVAMARTNDPDSNGSQFFLVYKDTELPAPGYSIFGRITKGLDVLQKVAEKGVADGGGGEAPAEPVRLESVTTSRP